MSEENVEFVRRRMEFRPAGEDGVIARLAYFNDQRAALDAAGLGA